MAYQIQGQLPFSGGGGNDYASAYNAALQMNQSNYQNILGGYQQSANENQAAQARIQSGYGNLSASVLGGLQGIDRSQRNAISAQYAQNRGAASQSLISRGLGNSTIQSSVDRGLQFDKSKADIALTNSTQGLYAQYESQLGLAGLNYQGQAAAQNQNFAKAQLDWMNSVNAGYPDPMSYARLAQMKGMSGAGGRFGTSAPPSYGKSSGMNGPGGSTPSYFGGSGPSNPSYGRSPYASGYGGAQTLYGTSLYDQGASFGDWAGQYGAQPSGNAGMDVASGWDRATGDYWTPPSADQAGGLTSLPMGDGTPDQGSEYYY